MLGREGYDPDKQSMRAACEYIDKHISANNLESLCEAINYISRNC